MVKKLTIKNTIYKSRFHKQKQNLVIKKFKHLKKRANLQKIQPKAIKTDWVPLEIWYTKSVKERHDIIFERSKNSTFKKKKANYRNSKYYKQRSRWTPIRKWRQSPLSWKKMFLKVKYSKLKAKIHNSYIWYNRYPFLAKLSHWHFEKKLKLKFKKKYYLSIFKSKVPVLLKQQQNSNVKAYIKNLIYLSGNFKIHTTSYKNLPILFIKYHKFLYAVFKNNMLYLLNNLNQKIKKYIHINFSMYSIIFLTKVNCLFFYLMPKQNLQNINIINFYTKFTVDILRVKKYHKIFKNCYIPAIENSGDFNGPQSVHYSGIKNLQGLNLYFQNKKLYRFKIFRKFFKRTFHRFRRIKKHKRFVNLFRAYFRYQTSYKEKDIMALWVPFRRGTTKYWGPTNLVQRFAHSLLLTPHHITLILKLAPSLSAARSIAKFGGIIINGLPSLNLAYHLKPGDLLQLLPKTFMFIKQNIPFQNWKYLEFQVNYLRFFQADWAMLLFILIRWPYTYELSAPKFLSERWIRFYIRQFPVHSRKYCKVKTIWKYYNNSRRKRRWF